MALDLWNIRNLTEPSKTLVYTSKMKSVDVTILRSTLEHASKILGNTQQLNLEVYVLSRLIARYKFKWRSSKDLKSMQKIYTAFGRLQTLQIRKVLSNFQRLVPVKKEEPTENFERKSLRLPSKDMLIFILIRLQSAGKLFCRILETSEICGRQIYQRLRVGHFWYVCIMNFALISRIYVMSKYMIKFICKLYGQLLPFVSKLENHNPNRSWLPNTYQLPDDLAEWLGIDWGRLDATIIEIPDDEPEEVFIDLVDSDEDSDDDVQFCNEYILINDSMNETTNPNPVDFIDLCGYDTTMDIGEEIL